MDVFKWVVGTLIWVAVAVWFIRSVRAARAAHQLGGASATKPTRAKAKPDWQKYGHPIFPLVEVREGLHEPPPGHFWELGRVIDEQGESFATLRLVEYSSSATVDEKALSLDNVRRGTSWAEYYDSKTSYYGSFDPESQEQKKREIARREFVTPLTEWSRIAYVRASSEPGVMVDVEVIA